MAHFRIVHSLAAIFALLSIALCIIGIFNTYTPVPFWDMWPGTVALHTRLMDGYISDLWKQHVSHRIVFSSLLFTIDSTFFSGNHKFLLTMHVALMSLIAFWFYRTMRLEPTFSLRNPLDFAVLMMLIAISFSWVQWRNITWAFQSQMFATNLFPATAFLLLYHSSTQIGVGTQKTAMFIGALIVGFCSAFTMMNGILALPLMVFLGITLRLPITRVLLIAATAGVTLALFFNGYGKSEYESSFTWVLLNHTEEVLRFAFALLGAPIHYFFTEPFTDVPGDAKTGLALASGIPIAIGLLVMTIRLIYDPKTRGVGFLFFALLLYSAATIGGIATGRRLFGANQALESRYMTNVLFTWSLFVIMFWYTVKNLNAARYGLYATLVMLPILFMSYQLNTLNQSKWPRWIYNVAVLAVELDIRDKEFIQFVYPEIDELFELTENARERNTSIFGHPLFDGLKEQIGTPYQGTLDDVPACDLSQKTFRIVENSTDHQTIVGLLFSPTPVTYPARFAIVSPDGIIAGFALTELAVKVPFAKPQPHATWTKGLGLADKMDTQFTLASDTYSCLYTVGADDS